MPCTPHSESCFPQKQMKSPSKIHRKPVQAASATRGAILTDLSEDDSFFYFFVIFVLCPHGRNNLPRSLLVVRTTYLDRQVISVSRACRNRAARCRMGRTRQVSCSIAARRSPSPIASEKCCIPGNVKGGEGGGGINVKHAERHGYLL